MRVELRRINIDAEEFTAISHLNDECPKQSLGSIAGSLSPQCRQPLMTMSDSDREYEKMMEERYGIREEGIF
jgi:hypothetical protein